MSEPLNWSPKDPNETDRFAIDWSPRLAEGETVVGAWTDTVEPLFTLETSAGLSKESEDYDDRYSWAVLSGGTAGEMAVIIGRVRTSDGNEIEETRTLQIANTGDPLPLGDYENPTPAHFWQSYPRFAGVPYNVVKDALTQGEGRVDSTWVARDYAKAIMLFAAHVLTLDGHGSGAEAKVHADGLAGFSNIRSGSLSLSRASAAAATGLASTSYGQRFRELLRLNHGGPRLLRGATCDPCSPFANDCG